MQPDVLPLSTARDKLSELVEDAVTTHQHFTITRKGVPAAVLLSADEWESIQETLFWMSEPGTAEALAESRADRKAGKRGTTVEEIRAELAQRSKAL
jgi:prevent-host-death family protein